MDIIEKICSLGGTCIPDEVWEHPDLTPTDIKLYKVLLDYGRRVLDMEEGQTSLDGYPVVDVAQITLAERVGVSIKTIQTSLKRLRGVRLICIDDYRGFKRNNHIILVGDFFGITRESLDADAPKVTEREVKRVPIKRVPIKIPAEVKYEEKLRELGGNTYTEKAILGVAKHYEMLARQFNHIGGYRALSKTNPQEHKNWKYFEKLFHLCREKGWDANLYLEAQFDRARKYWKRSRIKYPLPKMLCSANAQKYYEQFKKDRDEKYAKEGRHVNTGARKTKSVKQELMEEIIQTAKYLKMYVREDVDVQAQQEDKAIRLYNSWESYAPAYLWTVPWFHEYIRELKVIHPDNEKITTVLEVFDLLNRSKRLQEVVLTTVRVVEQEYKLPSNIAL